MGPNTSKGAHKNPTRNTQHPNKEHPKAHKDFITKAKTQQGFYKENITATRDFTRKAKNNQGLCKQNNTFPNSQQTKKNKAENGSQHRNEQSARAAYQMLPESVFPISFRSLPNVGV